MESFQIKENIEKYHSIPSFDTNITYGSEYNHLIPPIIPIKKFNNWYNLRLDSYSDKFHYYYFNIKFNDKEIRPKNTAIKVWERIG